MQNAKPDGHLDLLRLDALRTGEGTPADMAHLEACGACKEALEDLKRLASRLEGLRARFAGVPRERDQAILEMAQGELHRAAVHRNLARKLVRPRLWWSAAAAVVLIALSLTIWVLPTRRLTLVARLEPADIDRSGSVDI